MNNLNTKLSYPIKNYKPNLYKNKTLLPIYVNIFIHVKIFKTLILANSVNRVVNKPSS